MRRPTTQTRITWSADIPAADHAALKALLPLDGGFPWLMRTSLTTYLPLLEANPHALQLAHVGIADFMESRRSQPDELLSNVSCQIARDDYERFNTLLPEWGSTTWFIRTVVRAFNAQMEQLPLSEIVERAVRTKLAV